jgi:hypothetical protein
MQLRMPLNLMAVQHLVPVSGLFAACAQRFSEGGTLFQTSYAYSRLKAKAFIGAGDVSALFEPSLPCAFMNAAIAGQ